MDKRREEFVRAAMQALLSGETWDSFNLENTRERIGEWSVRMADATIKALDELAVGERYKEDWEIEREKELAEQRK